MPWLTLGRVTRGSWSSSPLLLFRTCIRAARIKPVTLNRILQHAHRPFEPESSPARAFPFAGVRCSRVRGFIDRHIVELARAGPEDGTRTRDMSSPHLGLARVRRGGAMRYEEMTSSSRYPSSGSVGWRHRLRGEGRKRGIFDVRCSV
jgi:hypothetical protein